jgi:hypothetical protein
MSKKIPLRVRVFGGVMDRKLVEVTCPGKVQKQVDVFSAEIAKVDLLREAAGVSVREMDARMYGWVSDAVAEIQHTVSLLELDMPCDVAFYVRGRMDRVRELLLKLRLELVEVEVEKVSR